MMQKKIETFVEGKIFQNVIITLIIINAIILGVETSDWAMVNFGKSLKIIDYIILKVFIIEILLRLYVYRIKFFLRPWSIFDFIVVSIALVPATEAFAALRTLRVLRSPKAAVHDSINAY